jgi:membrane-associated phospholipid phosphatase
LTGLSLAGSTVAEAYQVLLRAAVVINLVPFVYAFVALMTLDVASAVQRAAGAVGALVTVAGILAVFLPTGEVGDVWVFELKMAAGVGVPIAVGLWLFHRSRPAPQAH